MESANLPAGDVRTAPLETSVNFRLTELPASEVRRPEPRSPKDNAVELTGGGQSVAVAPFISGCSDIRTKSYRQDSVTISVTECNQQPSLESNPLYSPEVFAAVIMVLGTNVFIGIAYLWRNWLEEERSYSAWKNAYRLQLSSSDSCQMRDFLPIIDDRFVRAGKKSKELHNSLLQTIESFFKEKRGSMETPILYDDANALRHRLILML